MPKTTKKVARSSPPKTTAAARDRAVSAGKKAVGAGKKTVGVRKAPAKKRTAKAKATTRKTPAQPAAKKTPVKVSAKKTSVQAVKKAPGKAARKAPGKKTPVKAPAKTPAKTATRKAPAKAPAKTAARKAPEKKASVKVPRKTPVRKRTGARAALRRDGTTVGGMRPYRRRKGERYMNRRQLGHFRKLMIAWKEDLMQEVDRTVIHMKTDSSSYADSADRATQEEGFSLELRERDRERKLIRKIEEALVRIDNNEYGYCDLCGIEIGISRLEARPTATMCIDCKTLDEIKEKQVASV